MAIGEKKVSVMTFLEDVPDDAKLYVVKPGDTTPYYTTKSVLLAGISATSGLTKVLFEETDITVPTGFSGAVINLNNTNSDVTYTVAGTLMTITGGADAGDVLIF